MTLTPGAEEALRRYLQFHEADIAKKEDDFGELAEVFFDVFGFFPHK